MLTSTAMMFIALFFLLCLSGGSEASPQNPTNEASCYSRFDYESKMLERIVMVEHRMNVLQENTKRDLNQFGIAIKRMKKEQADHFHEMTRKFDVLQVKLQTAQNAKLTELTAVGEDMKNMSDGLLNKHGVKQDEMDVKFENMSKYLQDELSKNQNELVRDVKVFTDDLDVKYKAQLDAMTVVEYDMKDLAENLKEEQSLKLQAMEAIGMDIKVDIQERMLKLEETDRCQEVEFAKVYQQFEETVNNTWNAIKVSGLAIKPAVAFNIRDVTNTNPSSGDTLKFSYVLTNTDSVYDSSTGLFTAPVNGTYWFSVQLCGNSNNRVSFKIVLNDKELSDTTTFERQNVCMTSNAVTNLQKGDMVSVQVEHSNSRGYYYGNMITSSTYARSAFMGALIH